jgi:hypothetical protein
MIVAEEELIQRAAFLLAEKFQHDFSPEET